MTRQPAMMPCRPILFVCTGNICRSPMAATVFSAMAERLGAEGRFRVDSAALRAHHLGRPADPRAISATGRRGYAWRHSFAREVTRRDFETSLLVGMGAWHVEELRKLGPAGCAEIRSLADYVVPRVSEVPDPYASDALAFERALDLIEEGCKALLGDLAA